MKTMITKRLATAALLALTSTACASAPDVFEQHRADLAQRALEEANRDRWSCPVVVANDTDQHLEVEYLAAGMRSELGVVPSGQRTRFDVLCDAGTVRAYGTVTMEGLYDGSREFRTRARLDRTKVAVLHFTNMHAVR